MQRTNSIIVIMSLFMAICIAKGTHAESVNIPSSKQLELINESAKRYFDLGNPDKSLIQATLGSHDFKALEKVLEDTYQQYKQDFQYERLLQQSYNLFSPENKVSLEDLDLWVAKTGSYMAYAARGYYKSRLGFIARGRKYISETPSHRLDEMQRLHNEAAKDLKTAIEKKSAFMPAYSFLIHIAAASNMPFTAKQMVDKAIQEDKRTFEVRMEYMSYLLPKWGGTYEEMAEFAQEAVKYVKYNPKLWVLQGDADGYRGMEYEYEGNYASAIDSYTSALQFGDRLSLLKKRAALYYKTGKREKAIADYKRVLYYTPADTTALQFSVPDR